LTDPLPPPVILLVEDEWLVRMDMADTLSDAGWEVLEAGSGEAALEAIALGRPISLLVTDIRLTGPLTGWDVAEAYRGKFPGAPVVYASANPRDDRRAVDGSIFLGKPSRTETLIATCRQLLAAS
jgi:CheY-like chemotaxis protein